MAPFTRRARRESQRAVRLSRLWQMLAGGVLLAVAAAEFAIVLWWGFSVDWDLSARPDTPRMIDSSLAVMVFSGLPVSLVFAATGIWVLLRTRGARRAKRQAESRPR